MINYLIYLVFVVLFLCGKILPQLVPPLALTYPKDGQNTEVPEDAKLNFMELANKYGHPAREYQVTTEDGYILTMHHIPGKLGPVFLQHGLIDSDDTFIIRGKNSMAIALAEDGYDLWFGNARGNRYSRHHISLNPDTDKLYWNFSMHEIGYYDLPTMIDFVLERTGATKLSAIGHSQGNAIFYVLGASKPEYNEKINVLIALAPICFLNNVRPPLTLLIDFSPGINDLLISLGQEELLNDNSALKQLMITVCTMLPFANELCTDGGFLLAGADPEELEKEFVDVVVLHYPTGTSRMNVMHLAQISRAKRFQNYDYGPEKNLQVYGSEIPPEYDLSKVAMRVELFVGKNDKLATVEDVNILKNKLPNTNYTLMRNSKMNHVDFVWGRHMNKYLFSPVKRVLKEIYE